MCSDLSELLEVTDTGLKGFFDSRAPLCATEENCLQVAKAAFEGKGFTFEAVQGAPLLSGIGKAQIPDRKCFHFRSSIRFRITGVRHRAR